MVENKMTKRMDTELKDLQANPLPGVLVEQINQSKWMVTIDGPKDSPYAGGKYKLGIEFENYPFKFPKIAFITPIYHPNIEKDGKLCKDQMQEDQWQPTKKIRGILELILSCLVSPVLETPINQEAAVLYRTDRGKFDAVIKKQIQEQK